MINVKLLFVDTSCEFSRYKNIFLFAQWKIRKISRFRFDKDKILSLFSGLLICTEASKQAGIKSNEIQFEYNEHEKPSIKNFSEFHFSVSHSGNCVAFASDTSPIGIDAEIISNARIEIAKRFFRKMNISIFSKVKTKAMLFMRYGRKRKPMSNSLAQGFPLPYHLLMLLIKILAVNSIQSKFLNICWVYFLKIRIFLKTTLKLKY